MLEFMPTGRSVVKYPNAHGRRLCRARTVQGEGCRDCIAAAVLAAQPRLEALAGPPLAFMQLAPALPGGADPAPSSDQRCVAEKARLNGPHIEPGHVAVRVAASSTS